MANRTPSTALNSANPPSGSAIIKMSGGTFLIEMDRFQFRHSLNRWEDVTGDGSVSGSTPVVVKKHNKLQDGSYRIGGRMVAGAAMGLGSMANTVSGTLKVRLDSTADAGGVHTVTVMVTDVVGDWFVRAVSIYCWIHCEITNTLPSSIEGTS